jgi:hypothetical protein
MSEAIPGQEMITAVSGARPGGRFVDFGAVHLLTTGALDLLARQLGRPVVDASRFRPTSSLTPLETLSPDRSYGSETWSCGWCFRLPAASSRG